MKKREWGTLASALSAAVYWIEKVKLRLRGTVRRSEEVGRGEAEGEIFHHLLFVVL